MLKHSRNTRVRIAELRKIFLECSIIGEDWEWLFSRTTGIYKYLKQGTREVILSPEDLKLMLSNLLTHLSIQELSLKKKILMNFLKLNWRLNFFF